MDTDLVLANVLGVLLVIAIAVFPEESLVRPVIGLIFMLFFPGYTLTSALFPKKKDLDGIERVTLSVGLSIAVVCLVALILNYTPFGITLYPILVSMFFFTFLMSLTTANRRKSISANDRFAPSFSIPQLRKLSKVDKILLVAVIAVVVISGGLIATFVNTQKQQFTDFYVLGPGGKAEGYPTNLTLGDSGTVILGVVNHEYQDVTYNIVVKLSNETIGTINNVRLSHEKRWEQTYTFTPAKAGDNMKLEFFLFREGITEPYHSLHLWISVKPR
jgi:uncharacterized membrane protein